ncbi:vanin-like protein 1 [Maniola jurtina]|uniref:vanin-like protein 1 n=1 Tax=Maniola jurtina TaxID=191418 RepID=UPI001E686260|nr:vanin-like protein 1 [Maniola jurtina]XP_045762935.1 vanin-like protein 1 [Maniola jurtina]
MELLKIVLCSLCLGFVSCGSESYKAAVVDFAKADVISSNKYAALIREAAQSKVDLLVLPTPKDVAKTTLESCVNGLENYDEVVKSVSAAAKHAQMYVVAPLYEKIHCQNKEELVASTLVFDRNGAVISVHRKPVNSFTKCNTTTSRLGRFITDFGLTFGVIVEEDLLLTKAQEIEGIKNFVVTDNVLSKRPFLFGKQFPSSWAFANNVNVVSASGIISTQDVHERNSPLIVATLEKNGIGKSTLIAGPPASFPNDELSQYVTRPLNLEASTRGYSDSVCHGTFCCQFYVKTSVIGTTPQDVGYNLVAFEGIHQTGSSNIGVQTCSVVACAGLDKRSCFIASENNTTNIKFNEISINANFSKENSAQFPTISTTTQTVFNNENLKFTIDNKDYKHVTTKIYDAENIFAFGIIGRDYSKDFENNSDSNKDGVILDFSEYISYENVQEFFDYVWIRLRVVIFIVSVYILEMM